MLHLRSDLETIFHFSAELHVCSYAIDLSIAVEGNQ